MAAPIVAGTVALMLAGEPEADAEPGQGDHRVHGAGLPLRRADAGRRLPEHQGRRRPREVPQGAGGRAAAIRRTRRGAADPLGQPQARSNGVIKPAGSAWALNTVWGAAADGEGDNIVWGTTCDVTTDCDNIVWGTAATSTATTSCGARSADQRRRQHRVGHGRLRRRGECDNIVWGTACGGGDCDNIVWGTSAGEA